MTTDPRPGFPTRSPDEIELYLQWLLLAPLDLVVEYTGSTGSSLAYVCREGLPPARGLLRRLRGGEAPDDDGVRGRADGRPQSGRSGDARPGPADDRHGGRSGERARHLLDRPAEQRRRGDRVPANRRGAARAAGPPPRRVLLDRRDRGARDGSLGGPRRRTVRGEDRGAGTGIFPVLTTGEAGPHRVEGTGLGFVPPMLDRARYHEARAIDEDDGRVMARRLAATEGLLAGTSTGLNVVGALQLAAELGAGHTVATVAVDTGLKYLAGDLYRP